MLQPVAPILLAADKLRASQEAQAFFPCKEWAGHCYRLPTCFWQAIVMKVKNGVWETSLIHMVLDKSISLGL